MPPAQLRSTCTTLFGPRWKTAFARLHKRDVGSHVDTQTVRRRVSGKVPVTIAVGMLLRA